MRVLRGLAAIAFLLVQLPLTSKPAACHNPATAQHHEQCSQPISHDCAVMTSCVIVAEAPAVASAAKGLVHTLQPAFTAGRATPRYFAPETSPPRA